MTPRYNHPLWESMGRSTHFSSHRTLIRAVAKRSRLRFMKIKRLILFAVVAGAAVAAYLKQQQQQPAGPEDIWKPVDPLRPFGDRSDTQ